MIDFTGIGFIIVFGVVAFVGLIVMVLVAIVCLLFGWQISGWALLAMLVATVVAGIIGGTIAEPKVWR